MIPGAKKNEIYFFNHTICYVPKFICNATLPNVETSRQNSIGTRHFRPKLKNKYGLPGVRTIKNELFLFLIICYAR